MQDSTVGDSRMTRYQVCTRCIMDSSDPDIEFDANGVCNHCRYHDQYVQPVLDRAETPEGRRQLEAIVADIKARAKGGDYDCLIGVSGGVDSTFVAWLVRELGLRTLAVHCDTGWNSELAVNNIENIVKKLGIDLITTVVDWDEMRDLQLAFFKASLANCDIPSDHAIHAVLRRVASAHGIKTIISGGNLATEIPSLPKAWGYHAADLTHLRAVHKAFGMRPLRNFPTVGFFGLYFWYPFVRGIKFVRLLDYYPYKKDEAKRIITEKLGWRDYGGKHYESVFTRFFQSYYLPKKFGADKRRSHLSSLIVSGQITRDQALREIQRPPDDEEKMREGKEFVAKKLGVSEPEFDRILQMPNRTYRDFSSEERIFSLLRYLKYKFLRRRI